jgi:DHA1 family multidrug resistance protein-like MFS transporter
MTPHRNDWRLTTALFALTGLVESLAFGHLGAFTPLYLQELRVPPGDVPSWTGVLSALGFVIGLPLLPFWGVWADRFGRKLIIVRSSVAGALMFACAGLSRDVWMLAASRFLGGFILGNTGVMMAVQADITPRERLGTAIAVISAGSPVGMAVGPYLGGLIIKHQGIRILLLLDAALTALVACMLVALLREEPRAPGPRQGSRAGVLAAFRAIAHTPQIRALFLVTFLLVYGVNMAQPYLPILIERLYRGDDLAVTIGLISTLSGVAMAVSTPLWGPIGDRAGYLRMMRLCALMVCVSLAGQALAPGIRFIVGWRVAQGLCQSGMGALAMVLLTLYTPRDRRAAVLPLSLFPQQMAWFLGPLSGSVLSAKIGLLAPFWTGAASLLAGWTVALSLPAPAGEGNE